MRTLKPPALLKHDVVGIVSPASPITDSSKIERGVGYLESLGYRVSIGTHLNKSMGYLAGSDKERADDLHRMFSDRNVKAIVCLRGGYGTPRLLQFLDYKLIARNPKILVGFSDITALQLALWTKCRMITFHGPMLGVDLAGGIDPFTEEHFWRLLTSTRKPSALTLDQGDAKTLYRGVAEGRLLGGNLSLLVTLIGTPFMPDFRRAILFFEEVKEEPYRIDRMLMQLRNTNTLARVSGLLAGQFPDCVPADPSAPSRSIEDLLSEVAALCRMPFLANLPFGHRSRKLTLPIGLRVRLRAGARRLEFLEPSVS
jgi:muramoyltetrapeptide carboxypeptidase